MPDRTFCNFSAPKSTNPRRILCSSKSSNNVFWGSEAVKRFGHVKAISKINALKCVLGHFKKSGWLLERGSEGVERPACLLIAYSQQVTRAHKQVINHNWKRNWRKIAAASTEDRSLRAGTVFREKRSRKNGRSCNPWKSTNSVSRARGLKAYPSLLLCVSVATDEICFWEWWGSRLRIGLSAFWNVFLPCWHDTLTCHYVVVSNQIRIRYILLTSCVTGNAFNFNGSCPKKLGIFQVSGFVTLIEMVMTRCF